MSGKRGNFYARDPMAALNGMMMLTLEERGVYNTVLDLLYTTWRPLEDDRAFLAGWCKCAVQKVNPIVERLIAKGKLIRFEIDGVWHLSNRGFEKELLAVKGKKTSREPTGPQAEVREKSAGVGEKSEGVSQNPPLLDASGEENQSLTALEKNRIEEKREEPKGPEAGASAGVVDPGLDPDRLVWQMVTDLLAERGNLSAEKARSFFGKLLSTNRLAAKDMLTAVAGAVANSTGDPKSYLTRAAQGVASRRAEPPKRVAFV